MAAIVPVGNGQSTAANSATSGAAGPLTGSGRLVLGVPYRIRSAVAQATVGQVDWVYAPRGAVTCEIIVNVSAMAGTSPNILPSIQAADPLLLTDTDVTTVATLTTAQTAHAQGRIIVGPGVSGIANQLAWGTSAGVDCLVNTAVPTLMGIKILNSRANGNETYTYTVTVIFRGVNG